MEALEDTANIISSVTSAMGDVLKLGGKLKKSASVDGTGSKAGLDFGGKFAKQIPTHCECKVVFRNESSNYTLYKPRFYIHVGRCIEPLPPRIQPSSSGEALFTMPSMKIKGCFGVFTYDLLDVSTKACTKRIAVLYWVPFDQKKNSNQFGLGMFDISTECDLDLFNEMSKKEDSAAFVSGKAEEAGLHHESDNVTIMATMSHCYKSIMKVVLSD